MRILFFILLVCSLSIHAKSIEEIKAEYVRPTEIFFPKNNLYSELQMAF